MMRIEVLRKSSRLFVSCVGCLLGLLASISTVQAQTESASAKDMFAANKRLGRGINLGNFLEVPKSQNWGVPIQPEHLDRIKSAGFQTIRFPVKWSDHLSEVKPFTIDPAFANRVDQFVDRAEKVGLNVVLNVHHFDGLDKEPDRYLEQFEAIWLQLGKRYQSRGEFLYFELNNEPHDKLNEQWNDVLQVGLAAIRKTNPTRPVIIGPTHWNGIWKLPSLQMPEDKYLIATVHMYNPHEFTHQGASWASPQVQAIRDKSFGSPDEIAKVVKELEDAARWSREHRVPIYLGEFGAYEKAPLASRVLWTETVARNCERLGFSWSYWEFGAGFGAYDLGTNKWKDELLHVLIPDKP